jgi:hypothetical protein
MCDLLSTFLLDKDFEGRILSAWNKLLLTALQCAEQESN